MCDIPTENANINWTYLLRGLCDGTQYLHNELKILHNDIKSNNIVLDGCNLDEAEVVLVDSLSVNDNILQSHVTYVTHLIL